MKLRVQRKDFEDGFKVTKIGLSLGLKGVLLSVYIYFTHRLNRAVFWFGAAAECGDE